MSNRRYIQHLRSKDVETIQQYGLDKDIPKVPETDNLKDGEIAINYAKDNEIISIKNDNNEIVKFLNEKVIYEDEEITAAAMSQLKNEITNEINNIHETIENFEPGVQSDWDETDEESLAYIKNKPTNLSDFTNDSGFITISDVTEQVQSDWDETDEESLAYIQNKPAIPTKTSDLENDNNFITQADIPTIPIVNDATLTIQKEGTEIDRFTANSRKDVTVNIVETDPVFKQSAAYGITQQNIRQWNTAESNVQSDWNQTNELEDDYIKNKPVIDTELSNTSTNAVQNKVIQEGLDNIVGYMGELIEPIHTNGSMTYSQWKLLNEKLNKHKVLVYARYPVKVEIVNNSDQGSVSPVDGENAPISTNENEVHIYWYDMKHGSIYELYSADNIPSEWFAEDNGSVEDDESVTMALKDCQNITSCNWATKVIPINNNINKKADKTLIVNITKDDTNNTFSFDKTFSELYTAFNNGTNIIAVWDYRTYTTFSVSNAIISFYTLSPEEGYIDGFELYSDDRNYHYSRLTLQDVDYSHLFYSATIDDLMIGKTGTPVEGQYMPYRALTAANQQFNKTRYAGVYAALEEGSNDVIDHLVLSKTDTPPEGCHMVYFKHGDLTDKSIVMDTNHTIAMSYQTDDDTVPYERDMSISDWDAAAASPTSMLVPKRYSELFEYGLINYTESNSNAIVFFDKNGNLISDSVIDTSQFAGGINNVEVVGNKLVVTYNLGDGTTKQVEISLGDMFNPDDYYTTTQVDGKIAAVSHYDATWLLNSDSNDETNKYDYTYTISNANYENLLGAINAKKLIFAKTGNKLVYLNAFLDNSDYILMQFMQNDRRMNYHIYRVANANGTHTVEKHRKDFVYSYNVYSKTESDNKFDNILYVVLDENYGITNGVTADDVRVALINNKNVVYINNQPESVRYYYADRLEGDETGQNEYVITAFSIPSASASYASIEVLSHSKTNVVTVSASRCVTNHGIQNSTASGQGSKYVGYYSNNNSQITNVTTVSAALGKVDTLINTISSNMDSVNNSLSTLNNNISAVDNSSRVFRVGYKPGELSTLYKWNNNQWEAYNENQEAYNALAAAHTQGRVIQIIGFDDETNQNDGSIFSLQYFNETAVSAPTGVGTLSTFNMLFHCHCAATRGNGTTIINRINLYMNDNGIFQTVVEI